MKRKKDPQRLRRLLLGVGEEKGWIQKAVLYFILFGIGFIYLYPMLYMVVNAFFSQEDLIDPSVTWLPTQLYFGNFIKAWNTLDFKKSLLCSILMSFIPAILQTAVTAVTGYGFARFRFPLKKFWLALCVLTFIIPTQVTLIPRYVLFSTYKILDTPLPSFLPALLGQGLKSAVFILVFYQFFSSYPKAMDEAAEIDGAGKFKIFYKIALPSATPAIVLSVLFSTVWYWNETTQASLYFGNIETLPIKLRDFYESYQSLYNPSNLVNFGSINESITLAGTLLSVLPLLLLYLCLQRQFVESIEKTGITGE